MRIFSQHAQKLNRPTRAILKNVQGENNVIQHVGATLKRVEFNILGNNNIIVIHQGAFLNNVSFNLYGDNHRIILGKNSRFNERGSIWAEDRDCTISIGQDTTFEGAHLSATEPGSKLTIGEDCMFSYDIDLRTGDSHSILTQPDGERVNYAKNITFGNHIWVASHCIFTKGVNIPSGSIVGTGSLVNGVFKQENVLIAGRPARVLKQNVDWLRHRIYQERKVSLITESVEDGVIDEQTIQNLQIQADLKVG